jgi:hypothetical protein
MRLGRSFPFTLFGFGLAFRRMLNGARCCLLTPVPPRPSVPILVRPKATARNTSRGTPPPKNSFAKLNLAAGSGTITCNLLLEGVRKGGGDNAVEVAREGGGFGGPRDTGRS